MSSPTATSSNVHSRPRLIISIVLLAVTLVATPLFVVAAWANTQITNTDRYVKTVAPLADDPQIQQYVADELTTAFTSNVDLSSLLERELPPALASFSGTIASAVNGFVATAADRFTASPAFKTIWVRANTLAHKAIVRILTGDRPALQTEDGQLTLDLGEALRNFQTRLVAEGFELAGRIDLSGVDRQVVLVDSERVAKIERARDAVGLLNDLVWILGIVALVGGVASVVVAPARGAAAKRLGIGLALTVVVVGVALALTRRAVVSAASETVPTGVAAGFFDALVHSIRFALRTVFVLGLIMAVLVAIASLPSYATRWARPTQIGVAVLGVGALLVVSNPTWTFVIALLVAVLVTEGLLEVARRRGLGAGDTTTLAEA